MKPYTTKQQLREDLERRTDPERSLPEQAETILMSVMLGGCIGVRNGLKILRESYTQEADDFPCEEHKELTHRVSAGMRERMIAFEAELMNMLVELAWEVHECECDFCKETDAQMDHVSKRANAKYN